MPAGDFCPDDFYDEDVLWNTDNPNFTRCMRETMLAALPLAVLLVTSAFSALVSGCVGQKGAKDSAYKRERRKVTYLFAAKLLVLALLMANASLELIDEGQVSGWSEMFGSTQLNFALLMISYLVVAAVTLVDKYGGKHTSAPIFLYWLSAVLCSATTFKVQVEDLTGASDMRWEDAGLAATFFPLTVVQLLLNCWPDLGGHERTREEAPENTASFLSSVVFSWLDGLIWRGYRAPVTAKDLPSSPYSVDVQANVSAFRSNWAKRVSTLRVDFTSPPNGRPVVSIWPVMVRTYALNFVRLVVFGGAHYAIIFVSPQLLKLLINHVDSDEETWKGYLYTACLFASSFVSAVTFHIFLQDVR